MELYDLNGLSCKFSFDGFDNQFGGHFVGPFGGHSVTVL
jgi:hypothetical protein